MKVEIKPTNHSYFYHELYINGEFIMNGNTESELADHVRDLTDIANKIIEDNKQDCWTDYAGEYGFAFNCVSKANKKVINDLIKDITTKKAEQKRATADYRSWTLKNAEKPNKVKDVFQLQIKVGDYENSTSGKTNWLTLTKEEYNEIKNILITRV